MLRESQLTTSGMRVSAGAIPTASKTGLMKREPRRMETKMNAFLHERAAAVTLLARIVGAVCVLTAGGAEGQAPQRKWLSPPVLDFSVEDPDGTVLGNPLRITASPGGGFVAADWADLAVQAFSPRGEPLWRFGRDGRGPGEFLQIRHMEYNGDTLLVLDNKNRRLTALSADGQLLSSRRLPATELSQVLPAFGSGGRVLRPHVGGRDTLWMSVSDSGAVASAALMPGEVSFRDDLAGESFTSRAGAGAVVAFRWSSQLMLLDENGDVRAVADGIERVAFPKMKTYELDPNIKGVTKMVVRRVDPKATPAARSVAADSRRVFVLFRGATEYRDRIVDTYDAHRGDYRGSILLPREVADIAILADGRLATLETDFFPIVRVWHVVDEVAGRHP